MLGLTQADLAAKAGISKTALIAIETATSDPKASTLSAIQKALESAGVEFTNGDQPGVRLQKAMVMTLEQFLNSLRAYEQNRLQSKGIHIPGEQPKFGFVLVYGDRDFADLMFGSRALGRVEWQSGNILFDPPLSRGRRVNAFEDDLDEWVSLAHARGLTRG